MARKLTAFIPMVRETPSQIDRVKEEARMTGLTFGDHIRIRLGLRPREAEFSDLTGVPVILPWYVVNRMYEKLCEQELELMPDDSDEVLLVKSLAATLNDFTDLEAEPSDNGNTC